MANSMRAELLANKGVGAEDKTMNVNEKWNLSLYTETAKWKTKPEETSSVFCRAVALIQFWV